VFIHLFVGLPALAVAVLASAPRLARRASLRELATVVAVSMAVGAPSWIPAAGGFLNPGPTPLPDDLLILLLELRHPHHHMPWVWPVGDVLMLGVLVVLGAFAAAGDGDRRAVPFALWGWFAVSGLLFLLCTWHLVVPFVAYFQFFRISGWVVLVSALCVAGALETSPPSLLARLPGWAGFGAWLAFVACFRVPVVFVPLSLAAVVAMRRSPQASPGPVAVPRWMPRAWPVLLGAGLVGVVLLQFVAPVRGLANALRPNHWTVDLAPSFADRRPLTEWIGANTSPDDILLVPPTELGFRTHERRPIVIDWKFVPYTNSGYWDWTRRMLVVRGALSPESNPSPEDLRPMLLAMRELVAWRAANPLTSPLPGDPPPSLRGLQRVARNFGARWIVTKGEVAAPPSVRPVFRAGQWRVWGVRDGQVDGPHEDTMEPARVPDLSRHPDAN
jgi:hypothetical protein